MNGLFFPAAFAPGADALAARGGNTCLRVFNESLLIGSRVATWRPMQVLLRDRWPWVRGGAIYRSLDVAIVRIPQAKDATPQQRLRS